MAFFFYLNKICCIYTTNSRIVIGNFSSFQVWKDFKNKTCKLLFITCHYEMWVIMWLPVCSFDCLLNILNLWTENSCEVNTELQLMNFWSQPFSRWMPQLINHGYILVLRILSWRYVSSQESFPSHTQC